MLTQESVLKLRLKRDFFGDNAEVIVDGYEIEDYDWSDNSEIEEKSC